MTVLVVTPSSDRTSPTMCAASLVRWAQRSVDEPPRAMALEGGPLKAELRRAGVKVVETPRQPLRTLERTLQRVEREREARLVRNGLHRYLFAVPPVPEVVLAFTVRGAWPVARHRRPGTRLVTYCHEDAATIDEAVDAPTFAMLADATDAWIAADEAIAADLARRGVAPADIVVIRPFIEAPPVDRAAVDGLRRSLRLAGDEVVVGGFGLSRWQDGPDIFLRAASAFRRQHPDLAVRFVWVGASDDGPTRWILDHDVARAGLGATCTLTGSLADTDAWLGVVDLALVTARVDPPPPIGLQACAASVPIVGFGLPGMRGLADDVGGAPAVTLVPPLDVAGLADAVATMAADEHRRAEGADQMREHLRGGSVEDDRARALWEVVMRVADGGRVGKVAP